MHVPGERSLDDLRRHIEESLIRAKREKLRDVFWQEREYFLAASDKQPLFDVNSQPVTLAVFMQKVEVVWAQLPVTDQIDVRPIATQVAENEGQVTAIITWTLGNEQKQVESSFRLQPSPYFGWDVVQTSLLDDVLKVLDKTTGLS